MTTIDLTQMVDAPTTEKAVAAAAVPVATDENVQCMALVPFRKINIECAGPHFVRHIHALKHGLGSTLSNTSSNEKISEAETVFEIDVEYLRSLDPKEWKEQDHYAVLGLKKLRFDATDDDIKRAYRKIVLRHHPDKRKAQGEEIRTEDDYFTCITKAYEFLGNNIKRRSYDSIDPEFDDSLPTESDLKKDFYKEADHFFALNARWSEKRNVPKIGDENATREHIDHFYSFWYAFDSWREYSYLDEEDKEKGQDRDERRWIEKQNKMIRIKRKKEEMARIRSLVDLAYNHDPRIVKFKNEDKERKQAAKRARMSAAQAQKAEEERILREAQIAKEKVEQDAQKRIEQARMERERQKKLERKERKFLRDTAKDNNYFANDDTEKLKNMSGVEKIVEMLQLLELQSFNKELAAGGRTVFVRMLNETEEKLEEERRALFGSVRQSAPVPAATQNTESAVKAVEKGNLWTPENMQLLIKAVNMFPAGTGQRWEVIANYMNKHSSSTESRKFFSRDVLNKTKDLQSSDFAANLLKSQANENAFGAFEKSKKELRVIDNAEISHIDDANRNGIKKKTQSKKQPAPAPLLVEKPAPTKATPPSQMNGHAEKKEVEIVVSKVAEVKPSEEEVPTPTAEPIKTNSEQKATWTTDEQALLEQAIKTYPISTPDRWERIAECIPNRTKKDCLRRVKELVDRVNAKREAQQTVK